MATQLDPAPWLSVLIPVYNVSAHVETCLWSVLGQAGDGVEVLVLDDAGGDDSWQKVECVASMHPNRLRLLRHDRNRGLSCARNTLFAHAAGSYVWHLDSDDLMLAGAIERLRAIVEATAPDLVMCDFRTVRDRRDWRSALAAGRRQRSYDGISGRLGIDRSQLVAGLMTRRRLHAWSKIAKQRVWRQARFPEGRTLMQDAVVVPQLIAATRTWVHVDEAWIGYRQHRASALATPDAGGILDALESMKELKSRLRSLHPLDADAEFGIDYFLLRTMAWIARKLPARDGSGLDATCRAALVELLPDRGAGVIAGCRARHWYLRASRLRSTLGARGWLQ